MRPFSATALAPAVALAALGTALAPPPAAGQTVSSPYEFIDTRFEANVFAGAAGDSRGTLNLGPGGGLMAGARVGYELTGPFAVEAGILYIAGDREVYDPTDQDAEPTFLGVTDAHVAILEGRVRLNLTGPRTWNGMAPYIVGTLGIAFGVSGDSDLDAELDADSQVSFGPSFFTALGGGVRWLVGEQWGLRVEGGLNLWRISNPVDFRTIGDPVGPVPSDEWASMLGLTAGASYRF